LDPFRDQLHVSELRKGKGVCGAAWEENKPLIIANVDQFSGHIACDSRSNSEIVVPVYDEDGMLAAVLDVDSENYGAFDDTDKVALETICKTLLSGTHA